MAKSSKTSHGLPKRCITHQGKYKKYQENHILEKNKERKKQKQLKKQAKQKSRKTI